MNFLEYLTRRWDHLLNLTVEHAVVVLVAVGLATLIGVGLGMATYRTDLPRRAVLSVTGSFLTIPSLALFGLFVTVPLLGLGVRSVVVALVMYALLPIVRNTITGLREVDAAVVDSARGMGMGRWQRLWRIELPLAWPVILTGIRVSTQITVGIAAIGAFVLGPGLGNDIFTGLSRIGSAVALNLVLGGTLGVIVLAMLFDVSYLVVGKLTTSRGLR